MSIPAHRSMTTSTTVSSLGLLRDGVGRGQPIYDAVKRARSNNPWCQEGPWLSLSFGFVRTKRERAQPNPALILIPRGGPWP